MKKVLYCIGFTVGFIVGAFKAHKERMIKSGKYAILSSNI